MNACIEREKEYPTGLPGIPVAIPHSKVEGIKDNCVCFLRLKNHNVL
ncbi:MAG: PTS sugar transporter subunit IIA [Anaerostipes sp.]